MNHAQLGRSIEDNGQGLSDGNVKKYDEAAATGLFLSSSEFRTPLSHADADKRYKLPPAMHISIDRITYAPVVKSTSSKSSVRKEVLSEISCDIEPCHLSAWMGPSGSGKTSLISVVANLCKSSDITKGKITVNGSEGSIIKSHVGVVWQDDLLLSNLSVEETILFAARLKTPMGIPNRETEIIERVNDAINDLGLVQVRHSLIGGGPQHVRGISGGERKRVAVAVELVARPSVLLLDEPTSGLDSTTALNLVRTLKELALNNGQAIAVVVHQPRSSIFSLFDSLLLLSKGKSIFNGKPSKAREFLETVIPYEDSQFGISDIDWIMDTISYDEENGHIIPSHWRAVEHSSEAVKSRNLRRSSLTSSLATRDALVKDSKTKTGFFYQLNLLTRRSMKQQRGEKISQVSLIVTIAYTIFSSIFWWRIPDDTNRVYERNSLMFFILIAQSNSVVTASITTFQQERALLARERSKKLYSVLPYFIGKTIADMLNTIVLPSIYAIVVYWATNLRPTVDAFFLFMVFFYLTLLTSQSMGLLLSISISKIQISLLLAPLISIFLFIMGGFYVPYENINPFIRWATYLSQARYGYTGMILNEYNGRTIKCADDVKVEFGSDECPLPGEEVIASLDMDGQEIWFQVFILVLMQVVLRGVSYVLLRRQK